MSRETISATASPRSATPVAPLSYDDKIEAFAEILTKLENSNREPVAILHKIERNTSVLRKLSGGSLPASDQVTTATGRFPRRRFFEGSAGVIAGITPASRTEPRIPVVEGRLATEEDLADERRRRSTASTPASPVTTTAMPAPVQESAHQVPSERDNHGRFVGKSKSQEARSEQRNKDEKKSLLESLKDGIGGMGAKGKSAVAANAGTIEEAAGRATGGPIFEAAMELKGAVDSARDEDSMIGKAARWAGEKTGLSTAERTVDAKAAKRSSSGEIADAYRSHHSEDEIAAWRRPKTDASDDVVNAIMKGEKSDEQRHQELIKAILKGKVDEGKGPKSMGLPYSRKTGPGASQRRERAAKDGAKTGSLLDMLPGAGLAGVMGTLAAGGAAIYGISQALQAITTGRSDVNDAFKRITGIDAGKRTQGDVDEENRRVLENTKRVNAERRAQGKKELEFDPVTGMVKPGAVATASESGKGGAGTISTGKNDAGGASYGKKQLASAGGMNSPVAQFVRQSSHAEEFKGLMPGTPEFNQKWKEIAGKDKNFGNEQDAYISRTMSEPVIARAVKGGFNTEDVGIREALISQSVNHGPGGNKKILAAAQADLVNQYGSVDAAPVQKQIDALYASRKNYVNQVAEGKTVTAQKMRAKGDEQGALKAEGEAKQLRSMAGAGGRYDQENAITKELSATGGIVGKTAIAQKERAVEPVVEGEAIREKATGKEIASVSQEPMATAIATPVKDMRQRIFSRTRARTAALGGGSLEAKPIDGGAMATEPATSLATGMPARSVRQPERMTTARAEISEAPSSIPGPTQTGSDANNVLMLMAAIDKLNAAMAKMTGQDEAKRPGVPPIRTEFDDTMLTLMAYDRV